MPLTALADELVMERTSLYRTIAPLESQGAARIAVAGTGRTKIASLTPEGEALIAGALPRWQRAQEHVASKLGADAWMALSAMLLEIPELLESKP